MKRKTYILFAVLLMITAASAQSPTKRFPLRGAHLHGFIDNENNLTIYLNSNDSLLLSESLEETDALNAVKDSTTYGIPWRLQDVNFDGYEDVLYRSISGNVQQFEEVLLYRPAKRSLLNHSTLSEMPCLSIDSKNKTISSTCNHSSAAENWTETYEWQNGILIKTAQEGTMPLNGNWDHVIEYKKVRRNGKWVYLYKREIK